MTLPQLVRGSKPHADRDRFPMNTGFLAILFIACLRSGAQGQQAAQPPELAFTHVTVIDVRTGRLRPDMTVVITGNRIGALGPTGSTVAVANREQCRPVPATPGPLGLVRWADWQRCCCGDGSQSMGLSF